MKMRNYMLYVFALILGMSACGRDDYFEDSGTHERRFNGDMMQFLDSRAIRPIDPFDTLVQVIRWAGMEEQFKNEDFTFFAPPDPSIIKSMDFLNLLLRSEGMDSVKNINQVKPEVWRYFLQQYMIRGQYGLIDFPQVDTLAYHAYPGQVYETYNTEEPINVGAFYHDLRNGDAYIRYQGPRQILVSYIFNLSNTESAFRVNAFVASSEHQPNNGRVHILNYVRHDFGFTNYRFALRALEYGIDYND